MYKVGVCGHIGIGKSLVNGQTVKTKELIEELRIILGEEEVCYVDTHNWKRNPLKLILQSILLMKKSENLIILPAHNGVKIFVPLFSVMNKFYKKKIHYSVIGGWLPNLVERNKWLITFLRLFNNIFVETNVMLNQLNARGLTNVQVISNFKKLEFNDEISIVENYSKPYKLCIFSRIMKEKGVEDAIDTVMRINSKYNNTIYTLDLYGPIESSYKKDFEELLKKLPETIKYRGVIERSKSVEVVSKYYLLLFPTRFKTEGIPGTIIDSYTAGVPVVASNWDSANEIIEDKKTGFIFPLGDLESFFSILDDLSKMSKQIAEMRYECVERAKKYSSNFVVKKICDFMEK
jgi:glycosyltransferase involved in cell wall biosynthesis